MENRLRMHVVSTLAVVAVLSLLSYPVEAEDLPAFQEWLSSLRTEALSLGISEATLDKALTDLKPIPRVVELDRNQVEFTLTLNDYLERVLSKTRIAQGKNNLAMHGNLLSDIYAKYGVEPQVILSLWGLETNFGAFTGTFPVVGATLTLAYDGRRGTFFRNELFQALRILDGGHVSPDQMMGSWAGATGQFHFMPSSFSKFAVDYDGDGKMDIWNNLGDAFASAANYLSRSGWLQDQGWGSEIQLPVNLDRNLMGLQNRKRMSEWHALGVRDMQGGGSSGHLSSLASIIQPDGPGGRAYAVYDNYRVILKWNRSTAFAIAVGTLSDRIHER